MDARQLCAPDRTITHSSGDLGLSNALANELRQRCDFGGVHFHYHDGWDTTESLHEWFRWATVVRPRFSRR